MVEIRSSVISQPSIIDDWLKDQLVHIPKTVKGERALLDPVPVVRKTGVVMIAVRKRESW